MNTKLIPSFIHPDTFWYVVPLDGPDRSIELRDHRNVPIVEYDPLDETYWARSRPGGFRYGPFDTADLAREHITDIPR